MKHKNNSSEEKNSVGISNGMEKIVSLCKRRGFIFQGSEIYGGLSGTYDYGPLGVLLKENVKKLWMDTFVHAREDMYAVDSAILMNARVWKATKHVDVFSDPLVSCTKCKRRFRADQIEDAGKCPECEGKMTDPQEFNMMFKTNVGPLEDESSISYLRPETAQGMFVNFKNIVDTFHPRLPFGIAQIGKSFRNEIAPRDFIFRAREFEIMEFEYFIRENEWEKQFEYWKDEMLSWIEVIGLSRENVHELEVPDGDRAHYSKRTVDFEFDFPFGKKELYGLAYRTDFDLKNHSEASTVDLSYYDEETKERFTPHVIEPTFGLDRTILAILVSAYTEDEMNDEKRVYLKLPPVIAPVKVAVFPLLKNKPELVEKAREVYKELKKRMGAVVFDDNGNTGKRYRRQDEIGTPFCVTVDFDSLENGDVTVRDRDTGKQERVAIADLTEKLSVILYKGNE